jgi:DNA adenine methylase
MVVHIKTSLTKSPLRYPGGKSRAVKQIIPIIPSFDEYREPLVGGGAIFFALKQLFPKRKYWINDLNEDLYLFWKYCKDDITRLVAEVHALRSECNSGHELYLNQLNSKKTLSEFQRAARFFILNRITFSGLAESGGYSEQAFKSRFTESSISRLTAASKILQETTITNEDYEKVLRADGENVFVFLDPPYLSTTQSRLYGENGSLHTAFDHKRFANNMKKCKHNWLITYDDSPEVRKLFSFANICEWELQYGMNNYKQKTAKKGKELFISNYEIPSLEAKV